MRELVKNEQSVTIVPQDFNSTNKGTVLDVSMDGFRMKLLYNPKGLYVNHICDFYSLTDNGYLYFESYIQAIENNVITIANPVKHRFLQRRKFTRIKFLEDLVLEDKDNNNVYKVRTLDLSAGGMKIRSDVNIDMDKEYRVSIKLSDEQEVKCRYQLIRVEKGDNGIYTMSGRFTHLNNIDKMTLVQFCMKKDMETINKK